MPYIYLIAPAIAGLIAQLSKIFIPSNRLVWSWKNLIAYSGMPSSHAAITVSLTALIAIKLGLDSPLLAVSALFSFLALRDALGIRRYIGKQGKAINELVEDLKEDDYLDDRYPSMIEKVGHTPRQIAAGTIIGLIVAIAASLI